MIWKTIMTSTYKQTERKNCDWKIIVNVSSTTSAITCLLARGEIKYFINGHHVGNKL
jgi:hypothetical protein